MSFSRQFLTSLIIVFALIQLGCDNQSSSEKLKVCFEDMKSATIEFREMLAEVTDAASAETMLPKLEASHRQLAISVQELEEAELTTSRSARNIKREIDDFKKEQKALFKVEFERLKSDKFVKAVLEQFLYRINALE